MKKVFFSVAVISALALTSCGGGGAKADGQKFCDCMKEAMKDMSKLESCMKMGEEMETKYKDDKAAQGEIEEVMKECEKELKGE